MTHLPPAVQLLLLGLSAVSACTGVETGSVSPCHGQFRAEGQYFAEARTLDGARVVISAKNGPSTSCAD